MRTQQAARPYTRLILPVIISVLALADGLLHFMLDFVMFNGNLWGSGSQAGPPPGPPPGAAAGAGGPPPGGPPGLQLPLPNNELFVLNAIGYIVLVLVF